MTKIKVLLADDHAVLRSGLKLLINSQADLEVIGEVDNSDQVLATVVQWRPDILLLDLTMPGTDSIGLIRQMRSENYPVKILVLTMHEEEDYLKSVIQAGGDGYLLKKAADVELLKALHLVAAGVQVVDPVMAGKVVSRMWAGPQPEQRQRLEELSVREAEVLKFIALGYTNRQIAETLVVSIKTIESHKANIKSKLNLHNRSELVRYAIQSKII